MCVPVIPQPVVTTVWLGGRDVSPGLVGWKRPTSLARVKALSSRLFYFSIVNPPVLDWQHTCPPAGCQWTICAAYKRRVAAWRASLVLLWGVSYG